MCGILCTIGIGNPDSNSQCLLCGPCISEIELEQLKLIANRGPDTFSQKCVQFPESAISNVHLVGNVLWTQGSKPNFQPYTNANQTSYLLFNGDIYSFGVDASEIQQNGDDANDGQNFYNLLETTQNNVPKLLDTISKLEGPFAFIYLNKTTQELWFGRDFWGRESLVASYTTNRELLVLSSVSVYTNSVIEVPTFGIYCYKLMDNVLQVYPWNSNHSRELIQENFETFVKFITPVAQVHVQDSIKIPYFSTLLRKSENTNILERFIKFADSSTETPVSDSQVLEYALQLLEPTINEFLHHLRNAIRKRILHKPNHCKICIETQENCTHSQIGVLFSGGLDSMILATLAAELLQPNEQLDLINVAFFQDGIVEDESLIPDRQTGREAYEVLQTLFPNINLNFLPINIKKSELEKFRSERIRYLILPQKSVLDDSIGCCLWFAARGAKSPRILLVGSGADELFGGYSKHRSAYENGGLEGLKEELQITLDRISIRNLGRDNRVICDHGVVPRCPYLDEHVVKFLIEDVDVWIKCFPYKIFGKRGLGDKLLLRLVAVKLLGIENYKIALFPKRAMQFGSRIAKLENSKEKGGDICKRLDFG